MKAVIFACLVALVVASADWKNQPTPVFLIGASDTAKEAFYDIITRDWTSAEKDKAIDALVANLDAKVQAAYAKFKKEIEQVKAKYGQSVETQL